jgi:hypothetical protein
MSTASIYPSRAPSTLKSLSLPFELRVDNLKLEAFATCSNLKFLSHVTVMVHAVTSGVRDSDWQVFEFLCTIPLMTVAGGRQ